MTTPKKVVVVHSARIATRVLPTHELAARKRRKRSAVPTSQQTPQRPAVQGGH